MKVNYKRTILIGLAFLSISAFWQIYDNIIPLMLKPTKTHSEPPKSTFLALLRSFSVLCREAKYDTQVPM